jgi:4-hydroxy-tetrahydrodipicolinate synthase
MSNVENQENLLSGVFTALVTPFSADGSKLDIESLKRLIDFQLKAGIDGLVLCGSTGEAQTLTLDEYRTIISEALGLVAGRCPLIVGICASSTAIACEYAQAINKCFSESAGVQSQCNAIMVVVPPYNKPTPAGIVAHFAAIAQHSALPLIAYNVPGRTGTTLAPSTLAQLYDQKLIIGYKDASGSLEHSWECLRLLEERQALGRFAYFCGEDGLTQSLMSAGATGVISVLSNVRPKVVLGISNAMRRGEFREAAQQQRRALRLCRAMFVESNPIPVKMALAQTKQIATPSVRLPLVCASAATIQELQVALEVSDA